jgi:cytochrome b pre-mRNA-processing protein 3
VAAAAGPGPLAQALDKNILNGKGGENAGRLAAYATAAIAVLDGSDEATLLRAAWTFPSPARSSPP